MGRRKIEMKMVTDKNSRQVTFSKRRNGLFKKANELATLCAAQVAIIVFSPGGKPFSYGHPSVDAVTQWFLNQEGESSKPESHTQVIDSAQAARVEKLNERYTDIINLLESEKKRGEMIEKDIKEKGLLSDYKKSIGELGQDDLMKMKSSLEKLREKVNARVNELEASSSLLLLKGETEENDG